MRTRPCTHAGLMMRGRGPRTLGAILALVAGAGCARGSGPVATSPVPATRIIQLGNGLTLPAGERLRSLPLGSRFRFVGPHLLVRGLTSEDVTSAQRLGDLRRGVAIVLESQQWRESADSAEYDVAIFLTRRTRTAVEEREVPIISSPTSDLPRCDLSRGGNQPRCTNEVVRTRVERVSVPYTTSHIVHVIRRRSDGAVRSWVHPDGDRAMIEALVARDLIEMLVTPAG